jgi:hypothetical protein
MARKATHWKCDERRGRGGSRHPGEEQSSAKGVKARRHGCGPAQPDVWDVFDLGDEMAEPEPEYGDFWLEPNHLEDVC